MIATQYEFQPQPHTSRQQWSYKMGLLALGPDVQTNNELRAWGRSFALYKEHGQDRFRVDSYHEDGHRSRHGKFIRRHARYLREIFGSEREVLEAAAGADLTRIYLSECVYKVVSAQVRTEVYLPVLHLRPQQPPTATFAYFWRCGTQAQIESGPARPLHQHPVTAIVTGLCMFGSNLKGIDQHGVEHPLTNTFYSMPNGARIVGIRQEVDDLHPYENMMLRELDLQLPMLRALGAGQDQTLYFQSVFEEYVLYGINSFLRGEMTLAALRRYVVHVGSRVDLIRVLVGKTCHRHGLDWDAGRSTLGALFEPLAADRAAGSIDAIDQFAALAQIDLARADDAQLPMGERIELIRAVFHRCLRRLAAQPGVNGEVWTDVQRRLQSAAPDDKARYDDTTLLTLNFLNYAAKVAVVRRSHTGGELCLIHPFHEKAMALSYRDLHAEHCGEVMAINWIPRLFTHGAFKDGLYYLETHKDELNQLIEFGVLENCAQETAAAACGDADLGARARARIAHLLAQLDDVQSAAVDLPVVF